MPIVMNESGFFNKIKQLPDGLVWRHNQAGDLPHNGQVIDADALESLTEANRGRMGFTYTHHDMTIEANRDAIAAANANGFTVNLSGNSMAHADTLKALNIGPVVTVLPEEYQRRYIGSGKNAIWQEDLPAYKARLAKLATETPDGTRLVVCPATYLDDATCSSCALCARQRDVIVGFPAHGAAKRKASAVAA